MDRLIWVIELFAFRDGANPDEPVQLV